MRTRLVRRTGLMAAVIASTLVVGAIPASAAPGDGSAFGASVDVTLLGGPAVSVGPLAVSNTAGPTSNSVANIGVPGILATGVVETTAEFDDLSGVVTSTAETADVDLLLGGLLGGVAADAINVTCTGTETGNTGTTQLVGVVLGAIGSVGANPAPNTVVNVQVLGITIATLTFNEQIANGDGSLTVNGLHIELLGGVLGALGTGDIIISSATCGPGAAPTPMASGAGLWLGLGLLGLIAVPVGITAMRRRPGFSAA